MEVDPNLNFEQNIKTCVLDNEELYLYPATADDEKILTMPQARLDRVSHSLENRPRVRALLTEESLNIDRDKVRSEYFRIRRQMRPSNAPAPLLSLSNRGNMSRSRKQLHKRVTIDHTPLLKLQFSLLQNAGSPFLRQQLQDKFLDVNRSIEQADRTVHQMMDEQYIRTKRTEKEIDDMYAEDKAPSRRKHKTKGETFKLTRRVQSKQPAKPPY
jgi:hypothetical protein